jgi:HAD superfamily phosphatase (TIGR01668 family)
MMFTTLTPDFAATNLRTLDVERLITELRERQVKAVSFDLDDTITGHFHEWIEPEELDVLKRLSSAGFRLAINSNAGNERRGRVVAIAKRLGAEVGVEQLLQVTSAEVGQKKPQKRPYNVVAARLGLANHEVAHIGDQLLKDVLGANRAGYGASVMLIEPIGRHGHWLIEYVQRPVEQWLLPRLRRVVIIDRPLAPDAMPVDPVE